MNIDLSSKTILITGGLGAIAETILKTLAGSGASLVVTDRIEAGKAADVLAAWGLSKATYFEMDVSDADAVQRTVDAAFERNGEINVALGHAGGTGVFPFESCTRENFDAIFQFNFTGQTYFARAVLAQWRQRSCPGHLIFTSSFSSRIPMEGISAYGAAKAALEMFARNLALEVACHQIRVNCVSPGNVAAGSSLLAYESDPVYRAWVDRVSPLGRRNTPQAVANAFLYLCSSLADEVDGHVLQVDAGVSLPKLG